MVATLTIPMLCSPHGVHPVANHKYILLLPLLLPTDVAVPAVIQATAGAALSGVIFQTTVECHHDVALQAGQNHNTQAWQGVTTRL